MKYVVTLRDKTYEVEVEQGEAMILDEYEAKSPVPPAPVVAAASFAAAPVVAASADEGPVAGTQVKSPMPGNVLRVLVKPGQAVKEGETVVILEAMKMENEINAPCDGTVKQIVAPAGTVVATDDVLLVI